MTEFLNGLEPVGRFVSSVGLPVFLILAAVGMLFLFIWKGVPFVAGIVRELVAAFKDFLASLASSHKDMSAALAKLAAHTEQHSIQIAHLPAMHQSVDRIEKGVDALNRRDIA